MFEAGQSLESREKFVCTLAGLRNGAASAAISTQKYPEYVFLQRSLVRGENSDFDEVAPSDAFRHAVRPNANNRIIGDDDAVRRCATAEEVE